MLLFKRKDVSKDDIPVFGLPENLFIVHIGGGWSYKSSGYLYKMFQVGLF